MSEPRSALRQIAQTGKALFAHPDLRVLVACAVALGLSGSFVLPYMSLFGTLEVGMTLAQFGVFMTACAIANIAVSTVLSHRSDGRYSRRSLLLIGSAASVLGHIGYALIRDPWLLLLVGTLVFGVASVTFSQIFAHARELMDRSDLPKSDAPLYLSAIRMFYALSWTVGPALAAGTLRVFSFRGLFLVAAAFSGLLFFLVLFALRKDPPGTRAATGTHAVGSLRTILTTPAVAAWFAAFVFVFAAHMLSMANMSLFVLKELHGVESQVGVIFSLAPLFELPFMLYFGVLATRVDSGRLIRCAVGLAVLYYGLLSLVREAWHIYPLQLLSAAIVSITGGVAISFFQDKLPGKPGAATNLYLNASRIGSTSGYLLFGVVANRFGHRGAYVACAALTAAALLSTFVVDRPRTPARGGT